MLLLAHLAPTLRERPLVVLATMRRPDPADQRLVAALAELQRARPLIVTLDGLDKGALAVLVREAGLPDDPSLVDLLAARTHGNPFFVTELLRALVSRGSVGSGPARGARD